MNALDEKAVVISIFELDGMTRVKSNLLFIQVVVSLHI
jgi:hypothetical protein